MKFTLNYHTLKLQALQYIPIQQKGRPVCSTHCAQKKLMHTIASWIRNQCHFSSSAECFEFVRTSFFTHKSFDHYSLTQKQQSAFSIPTSCLMVSLYLFPGSYIENPILFNKKIPKCPSISFMQRNMNSDRNRKIGQAKYHTRAIITHSLL